MKRKGTTGEIEPCEVFRRRKFFVSTCRDIPLDLVLNLDQTLVSYVSLDKYTFDLKGSTTVLIKGVGDKKQITATFTVSALGSFLPIQLTSIMVKPSVVYPNTISLIALMLHSF